MRSLNTLVAARSRSTRLLGKPAFVGLSVALLFWWQSLTPTLIPRSWVVQAVVSGACLAVGYGVGALLGRWLQRLMGVWGRTPSVRWRRWWTVLAAAWLIGVLFGATLWLRWQNDQRTLMGLNVIGWFDAVPMVVLSALAGALLVLIGRALGNGVRALNRFNERHLPAVLGAPSSVVLILVLVIVLGGGVFFRGATALADSVYGSTNDETTEGTAAPTASSVSGSRGSLVPWETLGRMGRDFVATATTADELVRFHGADAKLAQPVRVYVGVRSADSLAERAELAVRELERAGGFDREVLVVWVPTGTGWVIPEAAAALEQLHRGNTAIVALQYSFLPSVLSVFMDPGLAIKAGSALFNAVRAHWSQLPPDHRPKLLVFGKSLGTSGVEAPFAAVDASSSVGNLVARTDGALVVGGKYSNPILAQLTRERDAGSPVWQPIIDRGRVVRFVTRDPNRPALNPEWPQPRIVYLQHPSDPVSYWGVEALWRPPDWLDRPRGYDVPEAASWFPIVSGVQAAADLIHQLSPPPGFGHVYSTDYVNGWAQVLPPDGWADADTQRLEQFLFDGHVHESEP